MASKTTKTCTVRGCQYSRGTRENVKMFKITQDVERLKLWKEALQLKENDTFRGMICIEHFNETDIVRGKTIRLKKDAVPISFNDSENCKRSADSADYEPYEPYERSEGSESLVDLNEKHNEEVKQCHESIESAVAKNKENRENCQKCNVLQAEIKSLKEDYLQMELRYAAQINILQRDHDNVKSKLTSQTHDSKLLKQRLEYAKTSKQTLQATLKSLKSENLLSKEIFDFVQASLK